MKQHVQTLLRTARDRLVAAGTLPTTTPDPAVERTRDPAHGDFTTQIALTVAKEANLPPRALAEQVVAALPPSSRVAQVSIAGPGFINFRLTEEAWRETVAAILAAGPEYGRSTLGAGQRVQVEFVSANPTGPLHVGHGRGAAYGAAVADLLAAVGFEVQREYYVNDAGRQMDILATSVWLRYLELCGEQLDFPSSGYRGDYVWDIAASLHREHGDTYRHPVRAVFAGLPADATPDDPGTGDREAHIDALIARTKSVLGDHRYRLIFELALNAILDDIRNDLAQFGVHYQVWYSERSLAERGLVHQIIERLRARGHAYERDGALWFRATAFGDEKDRVLVRENGQPTYFASDIAYHSEKLARGFARVIDIWGADHHGYVPRIKAALRALDEDADRIDVRLVQFAVLYRNGQKVPMSTRAGEFVTLRALRQEVGRDAARFFYLLRRSEQHLDFDLDLAKRQSTDNPVYYVQYAHARVASVLRQAADRGIVIEPTPGILHLDRLVTDHELALLKILAHYPEVVELAALAAEPHRLAHYLRELATAFHSYYDTHRFLVEEAALRDARIKLILAARQVLRNGLELLGVSAPDQM